MAEKKWAGTTFGNSLMHRWLTRLLQALDIRMIYIFTYVFVIPPCLLRSGFKPIYRYFRQRWKLGVVQSFIKTYRQHCMFGQVVIDRFAMYGGRHMQVEVEGMEHFQRLADRKDPFIMLSSHIGNYELAGYSLVSRQKTLNALVYGGEKQSVMENRMSMFEDKNIRMIPVREDMSHLFAVDHALQEGEIVSMPADRLFNSKKAVTVKLLGAEAPLPQGPFRTAAMRGLDVLAVNVMKSGTTSYRIYVKPLDYDKQASRQQQVSQLASSYAAELERILTMYPTQWYNFYDFWK